MNQIINMVMRIIMRRVLSKGVDAGFKKAGALRKKHQTPPQGRIDDYGNHVQGDPTEEERRAQQEVRAARRARRERRGQA